MNGRHSRSSGGYDLRRQVARRRWDEDFEYYCSKLGTPVDSNLHQTEANHARIGSGDETILFTDPEKLSNLDGLSNSVLQGKRQRGRPKKMQVFSVDTNVEVVTETEIGDDTDDRNPCGDGVILPVGVSTRCPEDHLKVDAILSSEQITCLQEEEVSSARGIEKENLSEPGDLMDIDEIQRKLVSQKSKRRYRRRKLNEETDQKLDCMSSDDKIECEECHKLLKPSSFKQHLRTHSGEKPFACDMCDAKFTRKGDVERHVRIVHNKLKPYKCSKCHRSFGDKKNFRWHLMNHDKKLFYVCEVCGFKFGKREYWENHVRIIHPAHVEHKSEKCNSLTHALLVESENSVDDPVGETCSDSAKSTCNEDQEVLVENEKLSGVTEVSVASDEKSPQLRNVVPGVDGILSPNGREKWTAKDTDSDVMGTVVIQLCEHEIGAEAVKSSVTTEAVSLHTQNIFHMNTSDIIEIVQGSSGGQEEPITGSGEGLEENGTRQLVLSVGGEKIRTIEYGDNSVAESKLYGVLITDNLEKQQDVQTFVEALMAVVGKDTQSHTVIEAS